MLNRRKDADLQNPRSLVEAREIWEKGKDGNLREVSALAQVLGVGIQRNPKFFKEMQEIEADANVKIDRERERLRWQLLTKPMMIE